MNPLIQLKQAAPVFLVALVYFGLLPGAQAVLPAPDGGYPGGNTAEGQNALFSRTTGGFNTAVGWFSLKSLTTGSFNTGVGAGTLVLNSGDENTATGAGALLNNTAANHNTADGAFALLSNTTGVDNTAIGDRALFNNTTANGNTADGTFALFSNTTGADNTGIGDVALDANTTGHGNTAIGVAALASNTTGQNNTATGDQALFSNTTANDNTAIGDFALFSSIGDVNTAVGSQALFSNTTGLQNTAVGEGAGFNQTTGSNNVYIGFGASGVAGENNACYIASIFGQTSATGIQVLVGSDNKLGTTTSSQRFKEDIKPMDKASEALLALRPVTFRYKKDIDPAGTSQFGLVAEDVEKVNPDLVVRDKEGKPYSVRYDQVNAMLLNEFLKEHRKNEQQEGKIREQAASIATLKSTVAQQQKGMDAVTARLNEQAAQIQKVSAQLESSKPAPQVVNNP